jgi:RHS repeat-associated protein
MATKVPVRVARSSSIYTDVSVDQSQTLGASDCFSLGEYILDSVTTGYVQIANTGTTGYVFADAVKFQRLTSSTDRSVVLQQALETYTYDADGNLSGDGLWTYTWDGENRLIKMESLMSVPAAYRKKITFAYDYMGRRVRKSAISWDVDSGEYATWSATTLKFVYDGWNLVTELQGNRCIQTMTWGPDLSGSLQGAGGIGGLVFVREWNLSYISSAYPVYDGNGNVIAMVKSDGTVAASYDYSPYGELLASTGTYAGTNPFRFSTKYTDTETNLSYFGYRYYNPETGRWLNRNTMEVIIDPAIDDSDIIQTNGPEAIESCPGNWYGIIG